MDQIDFTGPFEVLSRMPDTTIQIIGQEVAPVRDVQGLRLSPDVSIAEAGVFDVLIVPGGHGQQALMHDDEEVLELIRKHAQGEKLLFSVHRRNSCGSHGFPLDWIHGSPEAGLQYCIWVSRLCGLSAAPPVRQTKKHFMFCELKTKSC
jgi:hypothetical protein